MKAKEIIWGGGVNWANASPYVRMEEKQKDSNSFQVGYQNSVKKSPQNDEFIFKSLLNTLYLR